MLRAADLSDKGIRGSGVSDEGHVAVAIVETQCVEGAAQRTPLVAWTAEARPRAFPEKQAGKKARAAGLPEFLGHIDLVRLAKRGVAEDQRLHVSEVVPGCGVVIQNL